MDREKILAGIDRRRSVIAEIGALTNPIARRVEGEVIYIDHADTETLRRKYAPHDNVDVAQIVEVDAVWGDKTLRQAVGRDRRVDCVIASHVIEHVPDPIGWFGEIAEILKPGGELRLVIPDRRFTFDILRSESRFADLLFAHLTRARTPLPNLVLDHLVEAAEVDAGRIWLGADDPWTVERMAGDPRPAMEAARDALQNGTYHDVHCWVFTPRSFALLMKRAAEHRFIRFECVSHSDTAPYTLDFFVSLRPCGDPAAAVASWQAMADAVEEDPLGTGEATGGSEGIVGYRKRPVPSARETAAEARAISAEAEVASMAVEKADLEAQLRQMITERDLNQERFEEITRSTSWRISRPLRVAARALRKIWR